MGCRLTVCRALVASVNCQPIKDLMTDTFKVRVLVAQNMDNITCDNCGHGQYTLTSRAHAVFGQIILANCISSGCYHTFTVGTN